MTYSVHNIPNNTLEVAIANYIIDKLTSPSFIQLVDEALDEFNTDESQKEWYMGSGNIETKIPLLYTQLSDNKRRQIETMVINYLQEHWGNK
jgi:hypothetical protein